MKHASSPRRSGLVSAFLVFGLAACEGGTIDAGGPCQGTTCGPVTACASDADCVTPAICELGVGATCDAGECRYPARICDSPPSPACLDEDTYRSYFATGTCDPLNGSCTYIERDVACPDCAIACAALCSGVSCPVGECQSSGVCAPDVLPDHCLYTDATDGTPCGGGVCVAGDCVACREPSDCPLPTGAHPECFVRDCQNNTCVLLPQPAVQCETASCSDGVVTLARTCGADGSCAPSGPGSEPCGGYACAPDGVSCRTSCADPTDCVPGLTCLPNQTCEAPKGLGETCAVGGECATGFCADNRCCVSACDGTCDRCDGSSPGTCEAANSDCTGGCAVCTANVVEGRFDCAAQPTSCTGNCDVCQGGGQVFACAADASACTGNCDVCQGGGQAFNCAANDAVCGNCETCVGGGASFSCSASDALCACPNGVFGRNDCALVDLRDYWSERTAGVQRPRRLCIQAYDPLAAGGRPYPDNNFCHDFYVADDGTFMITNREVFIGAPYNWISGRDQYVPRWQGGHQHAALPLLDDGYNGPTGLGGEAWRCVAELGRQCFDPWPRSYFALPIRAIVPVISYASIADALGGTTRPFLPDVSLPGYEGWNGFDYFTLDVNQPAYPGATACTPVPNALQGAIFFKDRMYVIRDFEFCGGNYHNTSPPCRDDVLVTEVEGLSFGDAASTSPTRAVDQASRAAAFPHGAGVERYFFLKGWGRFGGGGATRAACSACTVATTWDSAKLAECVAACTPGGGNEWVGGNFWFTHHDTNTDVRQTFAQLAVQHPSCTSATAMSPLCKSAYHRYCLSQHAASGYGPIGLGGAEFAVISCVSREHTSLPFVTWAELTGAQATCTVASGDDANCARAIHQACVNRGAATGFGPTEMNGSGAQVACLDSSIGAVRAMPAPSWGGNTPYTAAGNTAVNVYCKGQGFSSGFGPVTGTGVAGDSVACLLGTLPLPRAVCTEPYYEGARQSPTFAELAAMHPSCNSSDPLSLACRAAIHRYCRGERYDSGYGPVGIGAGFVDAMCVEGAGTQLTPATWSELTAAEAGCNSGAPISQACVTAAHEACVARGFVTGFGPVEMDGSVGWLACVDAAHATLFSRSFTNTPWTPLGNTEASVFCTNAGYASGFGPITYDGSSGLVACTGVP